MTARLKIPLSILLVSFIFVSLVKTISAASSQTESDYARDVRIGLEESEKDQLNTSLVNQIEINENVDAKVSTLSSVKDIIVVTSIEGSDMNKDFVPDEENPEKDTIQMKEK